MEVVTQDERTLTELDHVRLQRLIHGPGETWATRLGCPIDGVLDAAEQVPSRQVPADVVTMYSQVELIDLASHRRYCLTVCYPSDAEPALGFVSVLSPVGASLIGRRVGSIARWRTPSGGQGAAEVGALLFQPEASGDYTT
ncbi:MAG: GreA/GreB family elongation factor [Burkholderiaceae bacterium]